MEAILPRKARSVGELVVQNGRQAGTRRPLAVPVTFVGQAPGCDIRLNVPEVDPLHCLVAQGPNGLMLRDFNSSRGTLVNGQRVSSVLLQDGDVIEVGPFQFRLRVVGPALSAVSDDWDADPDRAALRVQVAAVTAQQTALDEEEGRLQQRRADLQQQEEQLAAHLEEQRRQIQEGSAQIRQEREEWFRERADHDSKIEMLAQELTRGQAKLQQDQQKLLSERQRLAKLYHRLRDRWHQRRAAEQKQLDQQGEELRRARAEVEQQRTVLEAGEKALAQSVLQFTTERELTLRRLSDDTSELQAQRTRWLARRRQEKSVLDVRARKLAYAEQQLQGCRAGLVAEKEAWDGQQQTLTAELHGLNNRIVHQRQRMEDQQRELAHLDSLLQERRAQLASDGVSVPETTGKAEDTEADYVARFLTESRCANLDRLAGELADQRLQLVEQWERLTLQQRLWQEQRDRAAEELEALAHRLQNEEQAVRAREEAARVRREESEATQQEIHVWRARLHVREQSVESERQQLLEEVRQRESAAQRNLAALAALRKTWERERQQQQTGLETERRTLVKLTQELSTLRKEYLQRRTQLDADRRQFMDKAVALEEFRRQVLHGIQDANASRRLDRMRRRWLAQNAGAIHRATKERKALHAELDTLNARHAELLDKGETLAALQGQLDARQALLQERELLFESQRSRLEQQAALAESQRAHAEQRLILLRDEMERMARALLDDPEINSLPLDRAA